MAKTKKHILMTGISGEVGQILAQTLLERGYRLTAIIRPKGSLSAQERLKQLFPHHKLAVIEGDIHSPFLGLKPEQIKSHKQQYDQLIHSAALTRFDLGIRDKVFLTNTQGTQHLLDLATHLDIPEFHYVSTAYVAGKAKIFYENDRGSADLVRNPYEESKQAAENLVDQWPGQKSVIYRISTVVGNSQTGYSTDFKSFYGYLKGFWRLRDKLQTVAKEHPFLFRGNATATLNITPIDWIVESMIKILENPDSEGCYHLTHPQPKTIEWLLNECFGILNIPIIFDHNQSLNRIGHSLSWKVLQKLIDRAVSVYTPYIEHEAKFDNRRLRELLGETYQDPPAMTSELLHRLLAYAIEQNFNLGTKNKTLTLPIFARNSQNKQATHQAIKRDPVAKTKLEPQQKQLEPND